MGQALICDIRFTSLSAWRLRALLDSRLALTARQRGVNDCAGLRVALRNYVLIGVDGNGNTALFDDFKRLLGFVGFGLGEAVFMALLSVFVLSTQISKPL
jgi:hypothetical protein